MRDKRILRNLAAGLVALLAVIGYVDTLVTALSEGEAEINASAHAAESHHVNAHAAHG